MNLDTKFKEEIGEPQNLRGTGCESPILSLS